jgi:hypothetical protein
MTDDLSKESLRMMINAIIYWLIPLWVLYAFAAPLDGPSLGWFGRILMNSFIVCLIWISLRGVLVFGGRMRLKSFIILILSLFLMVCIVLDLCREFSSGEFGWSDVQRGWRLMGRVFWN